MLLSPHNSIDVVVFRLKKVATAIIIQISRRSQPKQNSVMQDVLAPHPCRVYRAPRPSCRVRLRILTQTLASRTTQASKPTRTLRPTDRPLWQQRVFEDICEAYINASIAWPRLLSTSLIDTKLTSGDRFDTLSKTVADDGSVNLLVTSFALPW